jgi:hypothetical protein
MPVCVYASKPGQIDSFAVLVIYLIDFLGKALKGSKLHKDRR